MVVLEQHDRAGGTTHVFEEDGFEFDTGFFSFSKKFLDFLILIDTQGYIMWGKLVTRHLRLESCLML